MLLIIFSVACKDSHKKCEGYWVAKDEFHMKKSVVEEEITLYNKMRFIPIQTSSGGSIVNDGIGLVSVYISE